MMGDMMKQCTNAACAMNGTKIKTASAVCIGCERALRDVLDIGDLLDGFFVSAERGGHIR